MASIRRESYRCRSFPAPTTRSGSGAHLRSARSRRRLRSGVGAASCGGLARRKPECLAVAGNSAQTAFARRSAWRARSRPRRPVASRSVIQMTPVAAPEHAGQRASQRSGNTRPLVPAHGDIAVTTHTVECGLDELGSAGQTPRSTFEQSELLWHRGPNDELRNRAQQGGEVRMAGDRAPGRIRDVAAGRTGRSCGCTRCELARRALLDITEIAKPSLDLDEIARCVSPARHRPRSLRSPHTRAGQR